MPVLPGRKDCMLGARWTRRMGSMHACVVRMMKDLNPSIIPPCLYLFFHTTFYTVLMAPLCRRCPV
jgi:hypothetical protein